MSRKVKNTKKHNSIAKRNEKAASFVVQRTVSIVSILMLLVFGLVSTTFASFVSQSSENTDSLVANVQSMAINQVNKSDIAKTGADTYYLAGTMNGWNTTSTPMTQGTDTNGQTFYYSGYYSNQEQFKVVKNGSTWLGSDKNSSSVYPNSLSMYEYGSTGNCWPGSGGYYVVYNPTKDKISCVTVLPLQVVSDPFEVGDVVYFDIRNNTQWLTADSSSQMYIQFDNSTTGSTANRAQLTRIGTYLYMYEFTSECNNSIRFWRGNSSSMWNYSKSLSPANGNGVYIASGGWSGSGTEATFSLTSISAPTLTVSPNSITLGESTTLSTSSTPTLSYKIGSTAYSTNTIDTDIKYTFKNGSTALNTASTTKSFIWTPTSAGTYSTYVTATSTLTGLTATSSAKTLTVKAKYTYVISANTGGKVSPESGSVTAGENVTITATPNTGFTFAGWTNETKGSVANANSATTTFTPNATGSSVKANFRPNVPSALTLTGAPVVSGTGSSSNPYIVFNDSGFKLTANSTVVTGASKYYTTTDPDDDDGYSSQNTFTPFNSDITTKGQDLSYTVYAKAYAGGYYSTNYLSATAHYMVFSHLDGANTGFTMSSDSITDIESVTFSGAYVNGVANAEKTYITQTYQISTNNSSFSDISGTSWSPDTVGTYYFRLKTTNTKTGETVYSDSKVLTVIQSTVYYDITVINDNTDINGTVTLKSDGTTIADGKILSNSKLTVSLTRPNSNYYIKYLEVDTLTEQDCMNVNGDITDYVAYEHVKGNVEIHYELALKPTVVVDMPVNATAISFNYYYDNVSKTVSSRGEYYVDYDSDISYTVMPETNYYVSEMTGVDIGTITAGRVTGTKKNVTEPIAEVNAKITNNNTVTVNVDPDSDVTEGGSMTIDSTAVAFGAGKALNYGVDTDVVITPPDGYYAVVSGNNVESVISTDGKATFKVKLTGQNKTYTVKFVQNPKIYMVQPQYGSVYVTDDLGNYYFNGDPVGYGTKLTVHVKPDHANANLSNVLVNNASIGTTDGSTFNIEADSTATATITVSSDFAFAESDHTAYGTRRIFFTDTCAWGNSNANNVLVHYSNTSGDTDFTKNNITMTRKYYNEYSQYVYYADIPFSAKYVTFVNAANTAQYSSQGTIADTNNAYYMGNTGNYPRSISTWVFNYSDYVATDRADTIQQATTSKGDAATFQYICDFGDGALSAEVVSGNAATFDFDKGTLSVTPTANTHNHTLVKVTSSASTTVKYYLVRVVNFEIQSFSGLQKVYNPGVFNNIQFDLILKGGVLNYAAKYFVSDTNTTDSYTALEGSSSGFEYVDSLEAYINSFLVKYAINSVSGVKYYKVEASDNANHKASSVMKTLFGTNTYNGSRAIYFYNSTNVNLSKYKLRACFMDSDEGNKEFVTMQQVGNTDYYRAVVPGTSSSKVNFYLCNPKTFSNNYADFDGVDDTTDFYSFGLRDVVIPSVDAANIVFKVTSIDNENGIVGDFVDFDY